MPKTNYTYSIADDIILGLADVAKLSKEIKDSNIPIVFNGATTSGDELILVFKDALNPDHKTQLDNLVANHNPENPDVVLEDSDIQLVRIVEEDVEGKRVTQGNFKAVGLTHAVPSGDGNVSTSTFSFPYDISIVNMSYSIDTGKESDTFSIYIAPGTPVGALKEDITNGQAVIPVTDTVVKNMQKGFLVKLNNIDLGYCTDVNKLNNTITVQNPPSEDVSATNSVIKQTIEVVKDVELQGLSTIEIGSAKIGGSFVPANTPIVFEYINNQGNSKTFSSILEFLY